MRAGTRAALCVYVPYVLSATLEFLRAVARECGVHVSLAQGYGAVRGQSSPVVSCGVDFLWPGALRWLLHERLNAPPVAET